VAEKSAIRWLKPEVSDCEELVGEGGVGSEQGQMRLSSVPLQNWTE